MRSAAWWPASPIRGSATCAASFASRGRAVRTRRALYWRYETAVRALESRLAGVTAGNGAINAVRREAYIALEPTRGQDISFPYELTKRGWRAVFEPRRSPGSRWRRRSARSSGASDGCSPAPGRRCSGTGCSRRAATGRRTPSRSCSHRALRYASPILHLIALGTNLALLGHGWVYVVTLAAQLALLAAAALAPVVPLRAFRIARYYVAVTAASAAGLWDYLRRGVPAHLGQGGGHAVRRPAAASTRTSALAAHRPGARERRSLGDRVRLRSSSTRAAR